MADFTAAQIKFFTNMGIAMPDGSYPIPDFEHLKKAVQAVGLGDKNSELAIRQHIIKRADALNKQNKIPATWVFPANWNKDGSLKHSEGALVHDDTPVEPSKVEVKDETNTTAVIVALPRELDPIRLVGPEEKHATLLYFGETSTLPEGAKDAMLRTVESIAAMSSCFSARIKNFQRLGSDVPPALVAMLDDDNLEKVRDALLVDTQLEKFLENATQYENYTPHVTLGYPDYFDEDGLRKLAKTLNYMQFNRLALWWGGEQFEFELGDKDDSQAEVAVRYSDNVKSVEDFLAHHGVKGMKWGVRKSTYQTGIVQPSGKENRDLSIQARKNVSEKETKQMLALHESISAHLRTSAVRDKILKDLNSVIPKNGADKAVTKEFIDKFDKAAASSVSSSIRDHLKSQGLTKLDVRSAIIGPGTYRYIVGNKSKVSQMLSSPQNKAVWHADSNDVAFTFEVKVTHDPIDLTISKPMAVDMLHHGEDLENFLEHHGIKGMKWGVRKERDGGSGSGAGVATKAVKLKGAKSIGGQLVDKDTAKRLEKAKAGTIVTLRGDQGSSKTMIKKKDGSWEETHISVDAQGFLNTRQKSMHEMSTRDMKEAINRQQQIDQYNKLFTPNENLAMKEKYDALTSKVNYEKTVAELARANKKPGTIDKITGLVNASAKSFDAFNKLNKSTGGLLGDSINTSFGISSGKHRAGGKTKVALGV